MTAKKPTLPFVWTALALLTLAGAARAQNPDQPTPCPPPKIQEELRELPGLQAHDGELSTTFRVELKRHCVPFYDPSTSKWFSEAQILRTYVYPDPAKQGEWRWGFPGPVLRVRRTDDKGPGDRLSILLVNNLPPDLGNVCDSACPAGIICPRDEKDLPDPATCGAGTDNLCCCWVDRMMKYPECFHGDNTTNLHFHGSHVSPQPPQDYVLLELRPRGNEGDPAHGAHGAHGRGVVAYGEYHYKLDRFPKNQAEGTHWYHPHKHGSVSLQVANGMPGALIIEGPFDDELRKLYGGKLTEKILFLQQIQADSLLYNPGAVAPGFLVNGQPQPKITLRPGEVQRWRFVNATMQAAAQMNMSFPDGVEARQIAMDGVQFAPENYERQPLFVPTQEGSDTVTAVSFSPGNRADFLVKAPAAPGLYAVTHTGRGHQGERALARLRKREEAQAPGPGSPPLFYIEVAGAPMSQQLPTTAQFPKMHPFLRDIQPDEVKETKNLTFSMSAGPGDPRAEFFINDKQFDANCVDVTTRLNTAADWKIQNTSALAHPFHIHINPFQVVETSTQKFDPPYVWQDTIALPVQTGSGSTAQAGWVHLRQRYEDFTGEYVLHCHFLGHEDRGMMFAVQTVCKDDPAKFGKPRSGEEPECVPYNLIPAAPVCPPTPAAKGSGR